MKPLKLHLQNFGPFLDETIDFSRIQSNQLFLISGKTGSGKTMILMGLCMHCMVVHRQKKEK